MRKIIFFTAIVFFMLISCRKDYEIITGQTARTSGAINSGGTPFNNIFRISLGGDRLYSPCTREVITISHGNIIIDVHGVYNENSSIIIVEANVEGVTAKGKNGALYTLSGSFNEQTSEFSNGVFTTRLQHFDRWRLPGSSNNTIIKDTYFIRVDAAGNVTLVREPVSEIHCG